MLEHEPDYREDLSAEFQRLIMKLDNTVGIPYRTDAAQRPFYAAQHTWTVSGRTDQRALRVLFYWLRGPPARQDRRRS
ncbi:hypothetical protein SY86_00600 [Erwinia tracheiphila]|uniref:Uncharacterized protein n=1 Tax=Erwinia tracheiphila TaxID=65700 RepID=A0A0M2KM45_9GAMM|nr:hypothetical protein [Erwinia tracheiphila]AXF75193.1 hypothetical protein AV903_02225 [Erwinia tracheiphila]KKF38066.1 hypothetical protein SY86_00600 [Erwinia tracheiphila]UIA82261.1 hypothetical protein LU604_16950 [Erwinia tracheiphila]